MNDRITDSLKKIESFLGLKKFFHEKMFVKMNPDDRFYCKDVRYIEQAKTSFMQNVCSFIHNVCAQCLCPVLPASSSIQGEIECTSDNPNKSRSSTFENSEEEDAALKQLYRLYAPTKSKLESKLNRTLQWDFNTLL